MISSALPYIDYSFDLGDLVRVRRMMRPIPKKLPTKSRLASCIHGNAAKSSGWTSWPPWAASARTWCFEVACS